MEVVELARAGAIHAEVQRLSLDDAVEGYRRLERGEVIGRAVVVPTGDAAQPVSAASSSANAPT